MKLNFGFIGIVKPIIKKKAAAKTNKRKIEAVVGQDENGNVVAKIDMKNGYEIGDTLCMPFTARSLDLQGKNVIYSKDKQKDGRYLRIERSDSSAFFGYSDKFLPFKMGSVVTGYIVIIDNIKHFDVK